MKETTDNIRVGNQGPMKSPSCRAHQQFVSDLGGGSVWSRQTRVRARLSVLNRDTHSRFPRTKHRRSRRVSLVHKSCDASSDGTVPSHRYSVAAIRRTSVRWLMLRGKLFLMVSHHKPFYSPPLSRACAWRIARALQQPFRNHLPCCRGAVNRRDDAPLCPHALNASGRKLSLKALFHIYSVENDVKATGRANDPHRDHAQHSGDSLNFGFSRRNLQSKKGRDDVICQIVSRPSR